MNSFLLLSATLLAASHSAGQTVWVGAGAQDFWSTAGNWQPAVVPKNDGTVNVTFSGSVRLTPQVDLPWEVRSINFDPGAGAFLVGGNTLGIGVGGLINNSPSLQVLSNSIALRGTQPWTANAGPTLVAGGVATEGQSLIVGGSFPTAIQGRISGAGELIKRGPSALILTASNSFSGGLSLEAGTLALGHDQALGTGVFRPGAGIVRGVSGSRVFSNPILMGLTDDPTFETPVDLAFSGPVSLIGNRNVTVSGTGGLGFTGVVGSGGGASLNKLGTGVLVLAGSAPNTLSGPTAVAEGTLVLSKSAGVDAVAGELRVGDGANPSRALWRASDQVADTSTLRVGVNGTADLDGRSETISKLELDGGAVSTGLGVLTLTDGVFGEPGAVMATISGNLNLAGGVREISPTRGTPETDLLIAARIDNGAVIKGGSGALTLSAANTFAGGLYLRFGSLGVANNLAAGSGSLVLGGGEIHADSGARTLSNPVVMGGALAGGNPEFGGIHGLTFSGPVQLRGLPVLTVRNTARTAFTGVVGEDEPGRGFSKAGAGVLTLGGTLANPFSGLTSVKLGVLEFAKSPGVSAVGGDLDIGGDDAPAGQAGARWLSNEQLPDDSLVRVWKSGVMDLNGRTETVRLSLGGGTVVMGAGILTLSGDISSIPSDRRGEIFGRLALGSPARVVNVVDSVEGPDLLLQADVSSGGLIKTGSGSLVLAGANTFAGGLSLEWGSIGFGHNQAAGTGPITLRTTGTSVSAVDGARRLANDVSWAGNISLAGDQDLEFAGQSSLVGNPVLTVENKAKTIFSGPIGETGGVRRLNKQGPGLLVLAGANSFKGGVEAGAGVLELAHPQSLAGGALRLTGAALRAGASPTPVLASSVAMAPATPLDFTLRSPGGSPLVSVSGNLELSAKLTVTAGPGFGAGLYPLFQYQGALTGAGLSAGSLPAGYTYSLVVSNAGQVVLAVAKPDAPPSPVTLALPRIGTAGMEFSFLAEKGRSYAVEYNTILAPTGWTFLRRITGDGVSVLVVDPDKSSPQRFYRILSE